MIMPTLKRLLLSLALLGAASLVLLFSDLHSRKGAQGKNNGSQAPRQVALLKHSSTMLLDEVERGMVAQLAAAGYQEGGRLALQRFNAEGDLPTANAIAQRMTDGSF